MDIEVTQQPFDHQMELCDLQSDSSFQSKKMSLQKLSGKCHIKRCFPSFEIAPLKCCHYLEAPICVKLHFPL
jgi:hypothetical protein